MGLHFSLPSLCLASQSPRRKQLLENIGLTFDVISPDVEEKHPDGTNFREIIISNALLKAEKAAKQVNDEGGIIIAADTLVVLGDLVLGKPADPFDATKMLRSMSGKVQQVFTGLVLYSRKLGFSKALVESKVYFRKLSEEEIAGYAKTIEPYDKAGAYAVQGVGAIFIDRIEGSYTNVMGLPVENLLYQLEGFTKIPLFHWIPQKKS